MFFVGIDLKPLEHGRPGRNALYEGGQPISGVARMLLVVRLTVSLVYAMDMVRTPSADRW